MENEQGTGLTPLNMHNGLEGRVFLTGGSGFLGRALMLRAEEQGWDCTFTVYSRDEYKQDLCRVRFPAAHYVLGDIRDRDRLRVAMAGHDVVIHAGALKYVPEAEVNVSECVDINVNGSRAVRDVAIALGIPVVVAVSTDKAVNPVNVYGTSKFLMERLFAEYSYHSAPGAGMRTNLVTVRYGNVIGSTGSVIPLFRRQLAQDGVVRITDSEMTRFWLTWQEAVNLVVEASLCVSGMMVLPKPSAMQMLDLACAVCTMEGRNSKLAIKHIGVRPGEKQHEELITRVESTKARFTEPYWYVDRWSPKTSLSFSLSSASPDHWYTEHEMIEAIQSAGQV